MAVVNWTAVPHPAGLGGRVVLYTADFGSGDTSTPMAVAGAEVTVQVTAISGATVTAQGTLEADPSTPPSAWATMKDTSGTAMSLTAVSGPLTVQPATNLFRVSSAAGTSTVKMMIRQRRDA